MSEEHHEHSETFSRRTVDTRTWSPAQFVAGIAGFLFVVFGGIALARLGFDGPITGETTNVAGMSATRLWAIIEIVLGLILLGMAASTFGVRSGLMTMGTLFAAFGVVVVVEPSPFADPLGFDQGSGVVLLVLGIVLLVAAWLSPTIISEHRRGSAVSEEREDRA